MSGENLSAVLALSAFLALTLLFVFVLSKERQYSEEKSTVSRIHQIAYDAFIIGIIVLMTFTPYIGFLGIGPFSLTLLHLPVLLGACLFGWKRGALYGLVFGLMSWIKALTGATNVFDVAFQKIYVAVPPRLLFGLFAGILFEMAKGIQNDHKRSWAYAFIAFFSTCLHTVMVFVTLFLTEDWIGPWLTSSEPAIQGTAITIIAFLGIGMGLEALLGLLLTPTLSGVVQKAVPTIALNSQRRIKKHANSH